MLVVVLMLLVRFGVVVTVIGASVDVGAIGVGVSVGVDLVMGWCC